MNNQLRNEYLRKIIENEQVSGTGMDNYDDLFGQGEEEYMDEEIFGGARRRKKKSSSYSMFVKRYAKKYGMSIPEASHEIKQKCLWKGTCKQKPRRKTIKRRSGSKAPRRKTVRRVRGRGYLDEDNYGGADIEDLKDLIKQYKKNKKNALKQASFNKQFDEVKCKRFEKLYLNAPINTPDEELQKMRSKYESCITDIPKRAERRLRPLTKIEKEYLLMRYLSTLPGGTKKKNVRSLDLATILSSALRPTETTEV